MRRQVTTFRLTVAGLVLVLALIVGLNGLGSFYTDIKPEVYLAPWRMVGQYLSAWSDTPYLGSANFNVGLVPVLVITGALRGIGCSPEWAFKIFHFALWLLAAWGAARLLRRVSPRAGRWAGLIAGVVYLANPYAVQAGATLAIALPYALLPWMLLAFVRALRAPGGWRWDTWVWPAAFGLIFFSMSGMNVAVVPVFELVALVPVMIFARIDWRIPWRHILAVVGKCALFVLGVSAYWLVPSFAAISHGAQIAEASETITGIAKVSSFPEVLRGLGLWPLYGMGDQGAWVPEDAVYLTSPLIMMLTILWPTLGLVALRWCRGFARRTAAALVAVAAVVMVGAFPSEHDPASPFGHAVVWFLRLPGMAAFRTTNKIGALLALGLALAIGVGLLRFGRRWWPKPGAAPVITACCFALLFAWTLPAITGRLYTSQMNIPAYWKQAAAYLNQGDHDGSVLFLPGQTRPSYRWTGERPDDVANSLLTRRAIIPETTPNASAPGANFLMAMDRTLQDGVVPPGTISTYARYLGADQLLVRRDTKWRDDGGARPTQIDAVTGKDPGLRAEKNFGALGEFVLDAPPTSEDSAAADESHLPPLQVYGVKGADGSVRVESLRNAMVVAGDGWSVPQMTGAGLMESTPTFRYAQDVSARDLPTYLGGQHRLVLTDTNARRATIPSRLTDGEGALLTPRESLSSTRTLGDDPDDQTVLVRSGARVSATAEGATFFQIPYGVAENALDGNAATSWLFGDFGRGTGQRLTITEPSPVTLHTLKISQTPIGAKKIDEVTVRAGGKAVTRRLPDTGYASFDLGGVSASKITVTIDSERGHGYNLVGINDISMPGPLAYRAARTPTTFSKRYHALDRAGRKAFDKTPLDVLLRRVQGTPSTGDDTQTGLHRIVTLPDERTFDATAAVRVDASHLEQVYDAMAGAPKNTSVTSSNFYFHLRGNRASLAADRDKDSGWVPGGDLKGAWWQMTGPKRAVSSVTIDQRKGPGATADRTRWASRVTVSVDGHDVATHAVSRGGKTTIRFPKQTGTTVRVTIDRASGPIKGTPARFTTIDTGRTIAFHPARAKRSACVTVATVDGTPLQLRPATKKLAETDEQGTRWTGCDTTRLDAGKHVIDERPGFTLDTLDLLDTQSSAHRAPSAPTTRVVDDGSAAKTVEVTSKGPSAVVIGQSYDPRWHATANGRDLGAPQVIDGYSVGWVLPKAGHYTITMHYGPQTRANVAIGISAAVLLLALVLIVLGGVRAVRAGGGTPGRGHPVAARAPNLPRPALEVALVALGWAAVGWAGLVAAAAVVAVLRWRSIPSAWLQWAGAALVVVAMGLYIVLLGDLRGSISADAVSANLWPHRLAGAGLIVSLVGALRRRRPARSGETRQDDDAPHTPGGAGHD